MEVDLESDDTELVSDSWNKVIRECKQIGFREGAFDGQELNFQKSFDIGYENGFKNGFLLGKYKGNIMSENGSNTNVLENQHLKETRKALCVICEDSKVSETSIQEIIEVQDKRMEEVQNQLKELTEIKSSK